MVSWLNDIGFSHITAASTVFQSVYKEFLPAFAKLIYTTMAEGPMKHAFIIKFTRNGWQGLLYILKEFAETTYALQSAEHLTNAMTAIKSLSNISSAHVAAEVKKIGSYIEHLNNLLPSPAVLRSIDNVEHHPPHPDEEQSE